MIPKGSKETLVVTLHQSRDHYRDGSPLDGFMCNCREYIETLWPAIESLYYQGYAEGVVDAQ